MSQKITISSLTANTPVDIYYCDSLSANCQYVSTVEVFPYTFYVEPPYDEKDILIKIVDNQNITKGDFIYITPTPTPSITASYTPTPTPTVTIGLSPTPTVTLTPSNTKTQTPTPTVTKTQTPTLTQSPTPQPTLTLKPTSTPTNSVTATNTPTLTTTPTFTPTPTTTPVISVHKIGRSPYIDSYDSCLDTITSTEYYTYISDANIFPVIGKKIYVTNYNGTLYNPFNGYDGWYKMSWGVNNEIMYSLKIDSYGTILDYILCS